MQTFQTAEPVTIDIEVGVGVMRIAAEQRDTTVVDVRPSNPGKKSDVMVAEQTTIEFTSGRLEIKSPRNWRQLSPWGGRGSVDIDVRAPSGSAVTASGGVADLFTTGTVGDVECRTGVGNVHVEQAASLRVKSGVGGINAGHVEGVTDIKTGSGGVRLGRIGGTAVIKNANGETAIAQVAGDVRVHSSNGNIAVESSESTVVAKSSNGDIRLANIHGGSASAHTAKGLIEIGVPEGVAAWLDLRTSFGVVDNQLEDVEHPGPDDSTVEVRAQTSFGDITVRRSPVRAGAHSG